MAGTGYVAATSSKSGKGSHFDEASQVKEIKICGRHIAYYRGTDKVAYAVAAYCPHMGANLGIGGKVQFGTCIE